MQLFWRPPMTLAARMPDSLMPKDIRNYNLHYATPLLLPTSLCIKSTLKPAALPNAYLSLQSPYAAAPAQKGALTMVLVLQAHGWS
jgi:hypothetical protein